MAILCDFWPLLAQNVVDMAMSLIRPLQSEMS